MKTIDIEYAKSILDYNPDTGLFTRKVSTCGRVKVGDIAGCKRTDGYIDIKTIKGRFLAHRLAYAMHYGIQPKEIDHINMNGFDNRICNLRECSRSENGFNKKMQKRNKSGIKGVSWCKERNKWVAQISKNNKNIYLGRFKNIEDAIKAHREAAKIHHGEFARIE